MSSNPLKITELALRDAHQSLFATRMRIEDMLPIAAKMDEIGYWSIESWGGATFDACIRFLGEDPWERLRLLKAAMPKTPQQMLLRGQNILGYRHYADDVVDKFVERAVKNGMDVFRTFDAMNDPRNVERALKAVIANGAHAQATLCYTTSEFHTTDLWINLAKQYEDMGVHSVALKDMSGLLKPYDAYEIISRLKNETDLLVSLHCHATTGLSNGALLKAAEAGVDVVDTSISPLSMTYAHTATETIVATFEGTERDTGLSMEKLAEIAAYFRTVRPKYKKFEGALQGVDSRILLAQVPGGMLTNMEAQLKQQNAADKLDEVLLEIPRVREDLGFLPLVTPTSQIVGTQAVINVLMGERYKTISKETQDVLLGKYGATPGAVNKELQARVVKETSDEVIDCRPADKIEPEWDKLTQEVKDWAAKEGVTLSAGDKAEDDILIYALFPSQVAPKFLKYRGDASQFEPAPWLEEEAKPASKAVAPVAASSGAMAVAENYVVTVSGQTFNVHVAPDGATSVAPAAAAAPAVAAPAPAAGGSGEPFPSPMAGSIVRINVKAGQQVNEGELLLVLEAMKMETEVKAPKAGTIVSIDVAEGDAVESAQSLMHIA
ncbi:MAG: sodium-extruding oxaloacetate decarboxylase subunit alpha [Alphaproteobacteria bacterium]